MPHLARGDRRAGKADLPFIPGHKAIGLLAGIGKYVSGLKQGDALGVPWLHDAYGYCEYRTTCSKSLYESQHNTGYSVNNGHAE